MKLFANLVLKIESVQVKVGNIQKGVTYKNDSIFLVKRRGKCAKSKFGKVVTDFMLQGMFPRIKQTDLFESIK